MCIVCNNPPKQLRKVTIWRVREDGTVTEDNDAWVWACCAEHDGLLAYVGGLRPRDVDVWPWAVGQRPGNYNDKAEAYLAGAAITGKALTKLRRRFNEYGDIADREAAARECAERGKGESR